MSDPQIDEGGLTETLDAAVRADLERRAYLVEGAAKNLARSTGTGRLYTSRFFMRGGKLHAYGTRVPHRASAPGEPPATDTGRLLNSISHTIDTDADGLYAKIEAGTNYARYLELGTSRMLPRPFLRPALKAAEG